jgi:tetratricopeptide (TPR) repeat protein
MSKKGHKGRSKKKAAVAERRPDAAIASVEAAVQAAPPAPPTEVTPSPVEERVEVTAPAPAQVVPVRPRIETPIAFESPRVAEPVVARVEADASIPPVDLDNHFFTTATHHADAAEDHEPHEERDPRMVLKLSPAAAKRRAQFQRYVKLAVGAASVLCLAALVKVAVAHNHEEPVVRRASASMQVAPPPVAEPAPTTQGTARATAVDEIPPPPPPAEPAAEPAAEPTQAPAAATAAAAPAAPETVAPSDTVATTDTAAPAEPDPKAAAKEKHASQLALERGKAGEAIEAGERSVALDPSDAEAWLILGAAYQEKGDAANARRSFKSCLSEGKRGPKWECAQFPH